MENRTNRFCRDPADLQLDEAIVATDTDGLIYWTNRAFRRLCGYSKDEVFGRRTDEFLRGEKTDPDSLKAIRAAIRKGESVSLELLNYHKKGRPYWVSINLNPTKADDGRLTGFIAVEHDVSGEHEESFTAQAEFSNRSATKERNRVF